MKSVLVAFVLFSVLTVGAYAQQWSVTGEHLGSFNTQRDFETYVDQLVSNFGRNSPGITLRWVGGSARTRTDDLIVERARRELPRTPARRSGWMVSHGEGRNRNVWNATVFFYVDSNGTVRNYLLRVFQ